MGELVRSSLCDIVESSEIDCYVAEGVFDSHRDVDQVIEYAKKILFQKYND